MKTDKLFVTQKDRFVHPMLINEYVVTVEEVNRVSNSMHLSLLSVDGDGALQVKASKVDAFMIFIGPETIDFFKERLYASLLETCVPTTFENLLDFHSILFRLPMFRRFWQFSKLSHKPANGSVSIFYQLICAFEGFTNRSNNTPR